jgi:hypothetical protein
MISICLLGGYRCQEGVPCRDDWCPPKLYVHFANHELVVRRNDGTDVACELTRRRGLHQAWPGGAPHKTSSFSMDKARFALERLALFLYLGFEP